MHDLRRRAGGQDGLEFHEKVGVLAEEVLNELKHFGAGEDFLRVHVQALWDERSDELDDISGSLFPTSEERTDLPYSD